MKAPSKPNGLREVRATPEAILTSRGKRPRTWWGLKRNDHAGFRLLLVIVVATENTV